MQRFPIGPRLTLKDGRRKVVVRYGRPGAFLPEVVIALDAGGRAIPRRAPEPSVAPDSPSRPRIESCRGGEQSCYEMPAQQEVTLPADPAGAFEAVCP